VIVLFYNLPIQGVIFMNEVAGRIALVTGSRGGIGKAIAYALAKHGATIVVNDLDETKAKKVNEDIIKKGGKSIYAVANCSNKKEVENMFTNIEDTYGKVDILVNNVGVIRDSLITKMSEEDWDTVLNVNLKSYFLCSKQAVSVMMEQEFGRIINISFRAWLGGYGQAHYSASKGGVVSFTRSLAIELSRHNITVNAIAPGLIDTPMFRNFRQDVQEKLIKMQPNGEIGKPEDIANGVLFFSSSNSSFVTGQTLHICGGKSLSSNYQ
jgi:NAD(P)-dependent dehydrogenase (short-subunit alcohol dehydrogenase family)